ncbi:MAG: YhjD/YihY/BrkB family envelope integrity protein [Campylobacterota bacterium]|nr:YhjD/YihY/BrkB family envelope integrity protein [Campylobacterota bacterium]
MKKKIINIFSFFNDDTPYYSASLSFFTIFSILPLIALLIVVVSSLPEFHIHKDTIMLYVLDFINPTQSESLAYQLEIFLSNTNKLGNIGIFYLLFVFTMFFKDYEHIINKIYNSKPRAIYKLFFLYLGFLIFIPFLLFIFVFISTLSKLTNFTFSLEIFTFLFVWIMFIILFILSANTKIKFSSSAIASFVTLISLSITKSLFGYYVATNTTYATIYGSFSVALFFFLWIYISWNIYLYGTKLCSILNKGFLNNAN